MMRNLDELWFSPQLTPATDTQIAAVEAALGVALPDDYRALLRYKNGGTPALSSFDGADGDYLTSVNEFFTVDTDGDDGIVSNTRLLREWIGDPALVAIADNGGGDFVILDPTNGAVSVFFHETEELVPVADSFAAFVDRLYVEPEDSVEWMEEGDVDGAFDDPPADALTYLLEGDRAAIGWLSPEDHVALTAFGDLTGALDRARVEGLREAVRERAQRPWRGDIRPLLRLGVMLEIAYKERQGLTTR